MWEAQIDNRSLKFHLAGINNQNFIMRDEETGSWWQQVSGAAMHGALKGRQLTQVFVDEISFAQWRSEHPQGRVLRPDEKYQARYAPANWDERMQKTPVVTQADPKDKFTPRTLIAGLTSNGKAKAYALDDLLKQPLIIDELGGTPLFIVLGADKKSVRAFDRRVDGRTLEFFLKTEAQDLQIVDAETGTSWNFVGTGVSGTLAGKQLRKLALLNDYWFDWKIYHPETQVYTLGERLAPETASVDRLKK